MAHYTIHADGGARGNPGPAGAGAVIQDASGTIVATVSAFLENRTNNYAEYEAIIRAFEELARRIPLTARPGTHVAVKMDSELVVKQMNGIYKVKHPTLKEQRARLEALMKEFGPCTFAHIPREQNKEADALANKAMDRGENP